MWFLRESCVDYEQIMNDVWHNNYNYNYLQLCVKIVLHANCSAVVFCDNWHNVGRYFIFNCHQQLVTAAASLRCFKWFAYENFYRQDNVQANLESVQCRVFQICKVFDYQYCKSKSRDPFPTPFDLIFHFYLSDPDGQSACKIWSF